MKKSIIFFFLSTGILLVNAQSATQWRGLDRTGSYPVGNVRDSWPEEGPNLLLHVKDLPETYSSVVVYNNIMPNINCFSKILISITMPVI